MSAPDSGAAAAVASILARFERLHPRVIDLSLGRTERLLAALGHPERRLPPVIHIAGTNGKGSTLAFLRAMLEAAGRRVHAYTSPHLVRFNERIRLAGTDIGDADLAALLARTERANAGAEVTFFEITTAAALLAFAEMPADVLLLEVGLGGRLDSTNVVAVPRVTCITPVDLDHQKYLGDALAGIAAEKAGILKPGVPAVVAAQRPEALAAIAARAANIGAPLALENRDWRVAAGQGGFRYEGARWSLDLPTPALPGAHQIHNAGAAIACLELLGDAAVTPERITAGLGAARWPARLQRLTRGPLARALPAGWQLWLDGAHNPHGGRALAAWLAAQPLPVHLLAGMLDSKDPAGFFAALAGRALSVTAVPIPGAHAGLAPDAVAAAARAAGHEARTAADPLAAIAVLPSTGAAAGPALVMICGSLYLAGAVLAENG